MLWAEKTARNRKKQQIFQSKDEILNKMGRENSQTVQFWRIFSAYNSYNAYDVRSKGQKSSRKQACIGLLTFCP